MARPLSFDPKEKLNIAMQVFWENGFNETSISNLVEAMQINKYSLYQQFGNKESLFIHSLQYYNDTIFNQVLVHLDANDKGKPCIDAYLEAFTMQLNQAHAKHGCLLMNTLLAGNALPKVLRNIAKLYVRKLNELLTENFRQAQKNGELKQDVQACVDFTLMTIQAIINIRKSHGLALASNNASFFRESMKSW